MAEALDLAEKALVLAQSLGDSLLWANALNDRPEGSRFPAVGLRPFFRAVCRQG